MIAILVQLIILACVASLGWWCFTSVMTALPMPAPIRAILTVLGVVVICLFLFSALPNFGFQPFWHGRY